MIINEDGCNGDLTKCWSFCVGLGRYHSYYNTLLLQRMVFNCNTSEVRIVQEESEYVAANK